MNRIIIYPDFVGVDVKEKEKFNYPIENISLDSLLRNEIFKDDKHFSSEKMKNYLKSMSEKMEDLPPILIVKNPIQKNKYNILDGHHRFQLHKELGKKTISSQVVDYKDVFLAKEKYGTKNNTAIRLDKVNPNDLDLNRYFNTEINQEIDEKWSQKYKDSIDCNNPKGFSQRAHCQGRKKKLKETEKLKGGLSDNMSLGDIAQKHKVDVEKLTKEFLKGVKVEMEHTNNKNKASEIAMDHLYEDPKYYTKLKKVETNETDASSSGSFEGGSALGKFMTKREIYKLHNANLKEEEEIDEITDSSSSGSYDVPFLGKTPKGRRNPLKIDGPKSIKKSRAVSDPKFPKWGGPKGVFIKVKEKCKKFPYCNQGIDAIELLEDDNIKKYIIEVSKNMGIPYKEIEKIVLNEINKIFI